MANTAGDKNKMTEETLGGFAATYEGSNVTKNIADIEVFDVGMPLLEKNGENDKGEKYCYKYVEDKYGVRYRVPWSVIDQIKAYREEDPAQTLFKVRKKGVGLDTRYTLFPVKENPTEVK